MTKYLENKIKTIKPHKTEAIVWFFKKESLSAKEMKLIYDNIKNNFPDNSVLALPDSTSLESCSKDVLENYISLISEIIEKL